MVFASLQTMSRTDADAVLEIRRNPVPSLVATQRPRPEFPGSLQEKAKCWLSGAQAGREGLVPVSFGVANRSSSVSSFSCAERVALIAISKPVITPICRKEIGFICLI